MENKKCKILNLWACRNYGAILTCFGVQCLMKKLGYETQVINYFPTLFFKNNFKNSFTEKFANKHLNLTTLVNNIEDFLKLNQDCNIFIAGSDQIWNNEIIKSHHENASEWLYLLDFVNSNAKKISYSASFGVNQFPESDYLVSFYKYYLEQFNAISVREDEGVDILKNKFNIQGTKLIDGAFHIPKSKLNEITDSTNTTEKYIGFYSLPNFQYTEAHEIYLKSISQKLNMPVKRMVFDKKTSVGEWLSFIKNSELMIASSYHAVVFSIIFNRPFLQIRHNSTQSRFDSLYKMFQIPNLSINITDNVDLELVKSAENINWTNVNQRISEEVIFAENWMKEALQKEKHTTPEIELSNKLNIYSQKEILKYSSKATHFYHQSIKKNTIFKYYKYKILSMILTGEARARYKRKYNELKITVNRYLRKRK